MAEAIKENYKNHGDRWWLEFNSYPSKNGLTIPISFHTLGGGMAVRNYLRNNVCLDYELPTNNWDDYYIQMVEIAVGVRDYKMEKKYILTSKNYGEIELNVEEVEKIVEVYNEYREKSKC